MNRCEGSKQEQASMAQNRTFVHGVGRKAQAEPSNPRESNGEQAQLRRHAEPAARADEPDELDQLLDQYEVQAAAATQAVQERHKKPASQKGMRELRDDGLATNIAASNKGFRLLQQMGYQPGQGLGRNSGGRADPLELSLKAGRTGLGVEEDRKRRQLQVQQEQKDRGAKRLRGQEKLKLSFREQQAQHFASKRAEKHVRQAREADADRESEERQLPPEVQEWEDQPAADKLCMLLIHLRTQHHHCIFCGAQYKDAEELAALCPGEEEDH